MNILLVLENDTILINSDILKLQKDLAYPKDNLNILVLPSTYTLSDYNITISIFHEKSDETMFKIQVSNETRRISDTNILTTTEDLDSVLTDTIYLIYNFRKQIITELFKNTTQTIYYFQKYNQRVESELKIASTDDKVNHIVTDNYTRCHVDDSLKERLEENDIILKGKDNFYKLMAYKGEYLLYFGGNIVQDDAVGYLNETNLKKEFSEMLSKYSFDTKPLEDAINNVMFEETINEKYKDWIKKRKKKDISADDLLNICCKVRHYDDHRKKYCQSLISLYESTYAKKIKHKNQQKQNSESTEQKFVNVIDNNPPGTLKDHYYSKF